MRVEWTQPMEGPGISRRPGMQAPVAHDEGDRLIERGIVFEVDEDTGAKLSDEQAKANAAARQKDRGDRDHWGNPIGRQAPRENAKATGQARAEKAVS